MDQVEFVPGTYEITDDGQVEARLYRAWGSGHPKVDGEPIPLLHGDVFGQAVSLVNCRAFRRQMSFGGGGWHDVILTPWLAIEGMWLEPHDVAFTDLLVRFWDQHAWTQWEAYHGPEVPSTEPLAVTFEAPESATCQLAELTLSLVDYSSHTVESDPHRWVLESDSVFKLALNEPLSPSEIFTRYLEPLEFLIVSATGRLSGISYLQATNREWVVEGQRHQGDRWVTVHVPYPERPSRRMYRNEVLYSAQDFDFARQIPLVCQAANQHRYSIEHYAFLMRHPRPGPLASFVAASQLVESFDRTLHDDEPNEDQAAIAAAVDELVKGANVPRIYRDKIRNSIKRGHEPSLEQRLRRLAQESGDVLDKLIGHKRWCADVATLRNIVIHGLERSEVLTRDLRPMQVGTEIFLMLFEARWLVEVGFDQPKVTELIERRAERTSLKRRVVGSYEHLAALSGRLR